jgi:diguanylate cyclase (GGDEF)-like protein
VGLTSRPIDLARAYEDLVKIGITLTSERDHGTLLERILTEARRFTRADAGTLFLRDGDQLTFAIVQNDTMVREMGEEKMKALLQAEPLALNELSLAGYVAMTGDILNLHDSYSVPSDRPYAHDASVDARTKYRTESILVVPLQDMSGKILGVLELINALDAHGRVISFDPQFEGLIRSLAAQAAVAIRNARLEDLSLKDSLTDVYNRRYFMARIEEETRRQPRFAEPVALVLMDLDHFKSINDEHGHPAGDEALKEVARLLIKHSRDFTVVTRYGGDEFAVLLVNTTKAGAFTYAERIRVLLSQHGFGHGTTTASFGVASIPEDATTAKELIAAADQALYEAKRQGRNRVVAR